MSVVIGVDPRHTRHSFVDVVERQESFANRKPLPDAGVLGENRSAGREVEDAPIAEPTGFQLSKDGLGARDFGAGVDDEGAVAVDTRGDCVRVTKFPSTCAKNTLVNAASLRV